MQIEAFYINSHEKLYNPNLYRGCPFYYFIILLFQYFILFHYNFNSIFYYVITVGLKTRKAHTLLEYCLASKTSKHLVSKSQSNICCKYSLIQHEEQQQIDNILFAKRLTGVNFAARKFNICATSFHR